MNDLLFQTLIEAFPFATNPWCVTCRQPLQKKKRGKFRYGCHRCHFLIVEIRSRKRGLPDNDILAALRSGQTFMSIAKRLSVSQKRVSDLWIASGIQLQCGCGKDLHHLGQCPGERARPASYPYSVTEAVTQSVHAAVSPTLDRDIREDVCQEMVLAILNGEKGVLERVPDFIKAHRAQYGFRYGDISLDQHPKLAEHLGVM